MFLRRVVVTRCRTIFTCHIKMIHQLLLKETLCSVMPYALRYSYSKFVKLLVCFSKFILK
jgi:hypothetical protein